MNRSPIRKIVLIGMPALMIATALAVVVTELWVRARWDPKRGMPGLFISDPVRGQRLAPGYNGWFAGVPVHINSLGFRDSREYRLEKAPSTFRILVLGDSVSFGHGAIDEATYPYLLEQRLAAWRPEVDWQVWNLGVPGYNTGQELAYLLEVGPRYQPDLVVVGFYENDFTNNETPAAPSRLTRTRSAVQRFVQKNLYSYELYKRAFLTARWRLRANDFDRERLEHLATEEALLGHVEQTAPQAQLSEVDYFDDEAVSSFKCIGVGDQPGANALDQWRRSSGWEVWLTAVRGLQRLHREGVYQVVFFANMAPPACPGHDRFYDGQGALQFSDDLMRILGDGTPAVSTSRAFLHYRPSQMPGAGGHSIGNANRVKADVLFEFLRDRVLTSRDVRNLR